MFKRIIFVVLFFLLACQTTGEKNIEFIRDRQAKLQTLPKWVPTWCRIESHITQPALAVYGKLFPEENDHVTDGTLNYTWKARSYSCEVTALDPSRIASNHQAFLETALCILLQTHWVNSPFEQLEMVPRDISKDKNGTIHIQSSMIDKSLGVYLDPTNFKIETRTKTHGVLKAVYTESANHEWLPSRLEQITPKAKIVIDEIDYDTNVMNRRHLIKSLWISVGNIEEPIRHAQLTFNDCQSF